MRIGILTGGGDCPGLNAVIRAVVRNGIDALVPIGGEDTLGVATRLAEAGVRVVGVPKTIDNDLDSTDYTFGFDTAVGVAMEAIDRLHTTGDSHHRTLVVEVMGRHAGWIALHAGMAGGANVILIPENPFDVDAVVAHCRHRFESGFSPIVVVSEGAAPVDGGLMLAAGERAAVDAVHAGESGVMVALRGTDIVRVRLSEATAKLKLVPPERYAEAEVFFG